MEQAEAAGEPIVLRGLVADWPAVSTWRGVAGLRRMAAAGGGATVQVRHTLQRCDRRER